MGRSARWLWAGLVWACAWAPHPTWGQVGQGLSYNRPSAESPSAVIGRIGGHYTRFDPLSPTSAQNLVGVGSSAAAALGIPSRSPFGAGGGGTSTPTPLRLGPIYDPYHGSFGSSIYEYRDPMMADGGVLSNADLAFASGLSRATRMDVPLGGWPLADIPLLPRTPLRAPPAPQGSQFDQMLGLTPAEKTTPAPREEAKFQVIWTAMEQGTDGKLAQFMGKARELFREATGSRLEFAERNAKLRQAYGLLINVERVDTESARPCLLLALTALERDHTKGAIHNLVTLAMRAPESFREGEKPASFYGDYDEKTGRSAHLDGLMRMYLQLPDRDSPELATLEAFCAWCLGDSTRARDALDKADRLLDAKGEERGDIGRVISALRYAL
jgi:hypothetical protein